MAQKLLPTLREKKRYVVFRVHSQERLDYPSMHNAAWNSLLNWMGEKELSRANVRIIKNLWDPRQQAGFVQCSPKSVDSVKMGLSLVHQIGDQRVVFQTLGVSGTIRSGKSRLKTHNKS
jgi:ribonuclease P/MRP protein subunit POP5